MNCLIVDDQKKSRNVLKGLFELDSTLILVAECSSADQLQQLVLTEQIDLIFLSTQLHGLLGNELAKIPEEKQAMVIFISAACEYTAKAFDLNVIDFLLKPFSPARFLKAVEKARRHTRGKSMALGEKTAEFVFIRDSSIIRKLRFDEILYFEATGDYVKIVLRDQVYFIHSSLKIIEHKLPEDIFLRIHRSFIVNLGKIDTAEGKTLIINQSMVPISHAYKADLAKRMNFL